MIDDDDDDDGDDYSYDDDDDDEDEDEDDKDDDGGDDDDDMMRIRCVGPGSPRRSPTRAARPRPHRHLVRSPPTRCLRR